MKYTKTIMDSFVNESEKKYQLSCIASGGGLAHNVRKLNLEFVAYRKGTIEEARYLEIKLIERLLSNINSDEKIKPFLTEYPFKPHNLGISVAFLKNDGSHYKDNSIVHVFFADNKLFYSQEDQKTDQLINIMEEPYEEALKIVLGTTP